MENLIHAIRKYISITDEDIQIIENLFEEVHIEKNEFFLRPHAYCKHLAFIQEGLLRHYVNNDGEEDTIYFSAENEFVCDFDSFLSKLPTKKGIIAIEATTLFSISHKNLQQFYDTIKHGDRFGRLLIETIFTKSVNHIISVHTDSAE
jgi:CRP-like cAMP-binding protein